MSTLIKTLTKQLTEEFKFSDDSQKALKRHTAWKKDQAKAQREADILDAEHQERNKNIKIIEPTNSIKKVQKMKDTFLDPESNLIVHRPTVTTKETVSQYRSRLQREKAKALDVSPASTKNDSEGHKFVNQDLRVSDPENDEFRKKQKFAQLNLKPKPNLAPKGITRNNEPFSAPNLNLDPKVQNTSMRFPTTANTVNKPISSIDPNPVVPDDALPSLHMYPGLERHKAYKSIELAVDAPPEDFISKYGKDDKNDKYTQVHQQYVALPKPADPNKVSNYQNRAIADTTTALRQNLANKKSIPTSDTTNKAMSDLGGFKEYIAVFSGPNIYRYLQYEGGTHRVQRVPETEAQGRVHTSTITVAILLEPEESTEFEINETSFSKAENRFKNALKMFNHG